VHSRQNPIYSNYTHRQPYIRRCDYAIDTIAAAKGIGVEAWGSLPGEGM
jgi:hypothetical protein